MSKNTAFYQDLHWSLRQNQSSEKNIYYFLEIIAYDPSIYTMDHPDFIVCSFNGKSIGPKKINNKTYHWIEYIKKLCALKGKYACILSGSAMFSMTKSIFRKQNTVNPLYNDYVCSKLSCDFLL